MKKIQQGFTLIELMIVVAIIGILAAVAIPAYQDYVIKAKLSKVSSTIDPLKLALAMYNQEQASFPGVADAWASLGLSGAPTPPAEVSAIAVAATSGAITITLTGIGTGIDTTTITMTPEVGVSAIKWNNTCSAGLTGNGAIVHKYFQCP